MKTTAAQGACHRYVHHSHDCLKTESRHRARANLYCLGTTAKLMWNLESWSFATVEPGLVELSFSWRRQIASSMFCKKTHLPYQEDKYYCVSDEHKNHRSKTQCMNPKRSLCAFLLHVRPYSSIYKCGRVQTNLLRPRCPGSWAKEFEDSRRCRVPSMTLIRNKTTPWELK